MISFFHLSELSYEVTDVLVLCVSSLSVIDLAVITVELVLTWLWL